MADSFLVTEYEQLTESLHRNEETGEQRLNVFLLFCGAVGTAGAFVRGDGSVAPDEADPLILVTLLVLIVFGYTTFLRLVQRNLTSDRFRVSLCNIRTVLAETCGPVGHEIVKAYPQSKPPVLKWFSFRRGGWLETLMFFESTLVGLAVADLAARGSWSLNFKWGAGGAAVAWMLLVVRGNALYSKKPPLPTVFDPAANSPTTAAVGS